MLTFMNSKKNFITSYEISSTKIYVGGDLEFIIRVFSWCIPLDHGIYTKCKKKISNMIKVIFSYICSGIKSQRVHKNQPFVNKYQKFLIFLRILLFHWINSLSTVQFHTCS